MSKEQRARIADYFDVGDFATYLGVTVEDLLDAFPEEVEEVLDDIEELMGIRHEEED